MGDLIHCWTFNDGTANDSVGAAHGTLEGAAIIVDGQLHIPGSGRFITSAIGQAVGAKTLIAWTTLPDPGTSTKGSALTLESDDSTGNTFDGIVYGENIAGYWMAGSDGWNRTQYPQTYGFAETSTDEIMIAIAYNTDSSITVYRNGAFYGSYTKGSLVTYGANALVQIGPRHANHADVYNGYVNEARIYSSALSAAQVAELYAAGPNTTVVSPANGDFEAGAAGLSAPHWTFFPGLGPAVASITVDAANPYYPDPPQGAKMANLEANGDSWSHTAYPMLESEVLGRMALGEAYTFCATAVSTGEDIAGRAAAYRFSLWDATAGEEIAYFSGDILTQNTTQSVTFTTPATDAGRAGHVLKVRLAADGHGYAPAWSGLRLAVDDVTVTTVAPAAAADGTWTNPSGGSWTTGSNWSGNILAGGIGATADFSTLELTADAVVTLDWPRGIGHLIFGDTTPSHEWTLKAGAGGPLTLGAGDGAPTVTVNNPNATLDVEVLGSDRLTKNGAGKLTLTDASHYAGPILAQEGTLKLADALAHRWSFNDGTGNDSVGAAHGTLSGSASIADGQLHVPGSGKFLTSAIGRSIGAKTLVVWTTLADPSASTKGSALTLESDITGWNFDGIVYGEAAASRWMAGSDMWYRTQYPQVYGFEETSTSEVMIAIVYSSDNWIHVYRNGALYGAYAQGALHTFGADALVQIGPRHGNSSDVYNGTVNEARIYRVGLTSTQVAALYAAGPEVIPPVVLSTASLSAASGATLDLNGGNQTVATLSGAGTVTKGTVFVSGSLEPGDAGTPGTLTVGPGLTLPADAALKYDYTGASGDAVDVNGTLTVQGANTVTLLPIGGATPPHRITLFTFDALAGGEYVNDWKIEGAGLNSYRIDLLKDETSIYLRIRKVGTLISLM